MQFFCLFFVAKKVSQFPVFLYSYCRRRRDTASISPFESGRRKLATKDEAQRRGGGGGSVLFKVRRDSVTHHHLITLNPAGSPMNFSLLRARCSRQLSRRKTDDMDLSGRVRQPKHRALPILLLNEIFCRSPAQSSFLGILGQLWRSKGVYSTVEPRCRTANLLKPGFTCI